jgi:hypothetical protein
VARSPVVIANGFYHSRLQTGRIEASSS